MLKWAIHGRLTFQAAPNGAQIFLLKLIYKQSTPKV
jgi:hypothetical protein